MLMFLDYILNWLEFDHVLLIFLIFVVSAPWLHAYLTGLWQLMGVTAIRSQDLIVCILIAISLEFIPKGQHWSCDGLVDKSFHESVMTQAIA